MKKTPTIFELTKFLLKLNYFPFSLRRNLLNEINESERHKSKESLDKKLLFYNVMSNSIIGLVIFPLERKLFSPGFDYVENVTFYGGAALGAIALNGIYESGRQIIIDLYNMGKSKKD